MPKKIKGKTKKINIPRPAVAPKSTKVTKKSILPWLVLVSVVSFLCLFPMLNNGFTNWDDEFYVQNNPLLKGPDWARIFTKPVNDNYHPLTILSLALNFQLSELSPFSYLMLNLLLHLVNTMLVFYFIWLISGKREWIAMFTAVLFGIHPMHVESVAWVSERKDVLYTLFFLLSLITYWKYLQTRKSSKLWGCFLFFALSLLSKPAAIILPFVLLLLDYWKGRPYNKKLIVEKIPFFLLSIVFAIVTLQVQSKQAIVGTEVFPVWERFFFACYGIMIYLIRFFIPYPLSAFQPFPPAGNDPGWQITISPVIVIGLIVFTWFQRKNKLIVFSILFYIINLLLVLQLVSIGNAIVAERYTYVPYIGLAFLVGTWLNNYANKFFKPLLWIAPSVAILAFGIISFQRTKIWNNSLSLWNDVIDHFPNAAVARTNRANYFYKLAIDSAHASEASSLYQKALEDCNVALKTEPRHRPGYEIRGLIFQNLHRYREALADGEALIRLAPGKKEGYSISSTANMYLNRPDEALADLNICIKIKPDDDISFSNRGAILYSQKKYQEAKEDFSKAILISPKGNYYLNRSFCYFELGDFASAKADAQMALQKGMAIDSSYRKSLNL
jgi:tetratricopeptide (TPR) repeat protein